MNAISPTQPHDDDQAHYDRTKVVQIVNSVIAKMENMSDQSQEVVTRELQHLADIIEQTRKEISMVRAHEVSSKYVPNATDELDAVVEATKGATDEIMSACEAMTQLLEGHTDPLANGVRDNITKIYEACTFQDITGQRIRKVMKVLREIEEKVDFLLGAIDPHHAERGAMNAAQPEEDNRSADEKLLNGPQMAGHAISQDEIDKLLASFD